MRSFHPVVLFIEQAPQCRPRAEEREVRSGDHLETDLLRLAIDFQDARLRTEGYCVGENRVMAAQFAERREVVAVVFEVFGSRVDLHDAVRIVYGQLLKQDAEIGRASCREGVQRWQV